MENQKTTFDNKCEILSELWITYRGQEVFGDFIDYNDIGLPLAFILASNIVEKSEKAEMFIDETFALLLGALDITDEGFESIDDMFIASGYEA